MSEADREVIDQLASTGTYVTRDGDGVLRHWNGVTFGFVNTGQAGTMTVPNDTGDKVTLPYDATAAQINEATGVRATIPDGPPYVIGRDYHLADENFQPIVGPRESEQGPVGNRDPFAQTFDSNTRSKP